MSGHNCAQLNIGGSFPQLHINPSVGMAFPKVIANSRLANNVNMSLLCMLPLMGVAMNVGTNMVSDR